MLLRTPQPNSAALRCKISAAVTRIPLGSPPAGAAHREALPFRCRRHAKACERVQAAISTQYSMLQRFGQHISAGPGGGAAVSATADSLLLVLSDACVLREAALSAAAALWMAATLPAAATAPLALEFVRGVVQHRLQGAAAALEAQDSGADMGRSFVQEHWQQQVWAALPYVCADIHSLRWGGEAGESSCGRPVL